MKIGGFGILNRTSDRRCINLMSWHSAHSLTWRWCLSLRRHQLSWPKPYAIANSIGFGAGLGTLLAVHAYRTNEGWQWEVCLLWHGLSFAQQRPMWFKDIYRRMRDDELNRDFASHRPAIPIVHEHHTLQ